MYVYKLLQICVLSHVLLSRSTACTLHMYVYKDEFSSFPWNNNNSNKLSPMPVRVVRVTVEDVFIVDEYFAKSNFIFDYQGENTVSVLFYFIFFPGLTIMPSVRSNNVVMFENYISFTKFFFFSKLLYACHHSCRLFFSFLHVPAVYTFFTWQCGSVHFDLSSNVY